MQELYDWIEEKLNHPIDTIAESLSGSYEFKKQGGLNQYAKLSIDIIPSKVFKLDIESIDGHEVFNKAIKSALFGYLIGRRVLPLLGVNVRIYDIQSHPVDSSYFAFFMATTKALEKAIDSKQQPRRPRA